jgi:hypothetical protein
MVLNATLIVQIGNFFIAWAMVRYLFMRPALKIRDAVKSELALLEAERTNTLTAIRSLQEQEYSAWHLWHLQARRIMSDRYQPHLSYESIATRVPTPEIPASEREKITDQLTRLLYKRLQEMP